MTVQIDDAGWGSLVGSTVIGAYRTETGEFACVELPMACFRGAAFRRKAYLDAVVAAVRELVERLGVAKKETVQVCSGYVLERARQWLRGQGYHVEVGRITGPLQELVEAAFAQTLERIGFHGPADAAPHPARAFFAALTWLKGGDPTATRARPERERWAKTGWPSYRAWIGRRADSDRAATAAGRRPRRDSKHAPPSLRQAKGDASAARGRPRRPRRGAQR